MKKSINIICCGLLCFSQIGGASLAEAKDLSKTKDLSEARNPPAQEEVSAPPSSPTGLGPLSDKPLCTEYKYKEPAAVAETDTCSIVQAPCRLSSDHHIYQESSDKTKLSTLWASEFVGMDLVRHEVDQHLQNNKLRPNLVAIFDTFDPRHYDPYHGRAVTRLITSDSHFPTSPFSVQPSITSSIEYKGTSVETVSLRAITAKPLTEEERHQKEGVENNLAESAESESEHRVESVQKLVQSNAPIKAYHTQTRESDVNILNTMMAHHTGPSYINLSRTTGSKNCKHFNKLYKQHGTVVVMATGNKRIRINRRGIFFSRGATKYVYDDNKFNVSMTSNERQCVNEGDIIGVGSVSPSGLTSAFSQEAIGVDIVAPGEQVFLHKDTDELTGQKRFGQRIGTSFSAAMVTGALAAFEQLSGYKLDRVEVKALLRKTAIPSLSSAFEKPPKNGAGVLNAYKIAKVAQKIKQICDNEDVKNFKNCAEQALTEDTIYEFKAPPVPVGHAFASCALDAEPALSQMAPSCDDKKQIFKQLRQQALLSPQNPQLWQQLSCIYEEQGFAENAKLMDATRAAAQKDTTYVESMLAREWPQVLEDIEKEAYHMLYKNKTKHWFWFWSWFNREQNKFTILLTSRLRAFNLLSLDQRKKWTKKLLIDAQAKGFIPPYNNVRAAQRHPSKHIKK